MALLTLDQAKTHLHIPLTTTDRDADVQALVAQASGIVITHLKSRAIAGWSDGSIPVPGGVLTATLLLLASLDEHRGDDVIPDAAWQCYLIPFRDPTLA